MAANTVLRLDSITKTFSVDKAPPYAYTINYSDGSSADHQVRFFTPLLGSGSQRYEVDTPPSFAGDWEWEIDVYGAPQADKKIMTIVDGAGAVFNVVSYFTGNINTARIFSNKGIGFNGNIVLLNNKFNKLKIRYVLATEKLSITVNNVLDVEGTFSLSVMPDMTDIVKFSVGVEAGNNGGGFTGYLANFKVINGSTLVIDAPLDKQYTAAAPTVINKADANNPLTAVNLDNAGSAFTSSDTYGWLGENNVGVPTRISDDWANNGDGSYTLDTPDGNFSDCELQFGVSEVGFTYFVEATVDDPVGNSSLRIRNCDPNIDLPTAGDYSGLVIAEISGFPNINRRGGARPFVQTISSLSNRQVLEVAS